MELYNLIHFIIAILFALTTHEAAHAWVANRLGDPTARHMGRVSLNPLRHLDPLGTFLFIFAHIGWGKPVPVNDQNFKHPQRDNALVALAGPATNLIAAVIFAIPYKYLFGTTNFALQQLNLLSINIVEVSLVLFALNCLPIPPLDGSKIFGILIPRQYYLRYRHFMETNLVYILIFFLVDIYVLPELIHFSIIQTVLGFIVTSLKTIIFIGT